MTSPVASATGIVKDVPSSLVVRDHKTAFPLLSIGEEVPITIVQRISDRQYLVDVKGRTIVADSEAPLRAGNELRVRMDQQHPRTVLRILSEGVASKDIIGESIRLFRSDPHGLLTNLVQTESLLAKALLNPSLSLHLQNDVRTLLKLMGTLRYSRNSADNRDYLRDYVAELGMLLECNLKKALLTKGERRIGNPFAPYGAKGLLHRLADKLGVLLGEGRLPDEVRRSLLQLQTAAEKTERAIENRQILNVMLRETENTSLLQIPLLFPAGMKLAEIVIRDDGTTDDPSGGGRSFTVTLRFDLDILGQVLIELRNRDKKLTCLFKCGDESVQTFICPQLPALQEKLVGLGYLVDQMTCVVEGDLEKQEVDLHRNSRLYADESINVFA